MTGSLVGALDLGSNSFHLSIAEVTGSGAFTVVASEKEKIQLGQSVFTHGRLSEEAFARGLEALRRLHARALAHGADTVLVVATSALRQAANGREFVRRAAQATGIPVRIIEGTEEARLTLEGVRSAMNLDGERIALFDLGGGSTEVVVAHGDRVRLCASLELGTLRSLAVAGADGDDADALRQHAAEVLAPTVDHVRALGFDRVVLSCGVARRLWRLADPARSRDQAIAPNGRARLTLAELDALERHLSELIEAERIELSGSSGARDTTLSGCATLGVLLRGLLAREATVAATGLREGLVAEHARRRAVPSMLTAP